MNVLAIETSTEWLSLAAARDTARHERNLLVGQRHAELVFGEIERLLGAAYIGRNELDAIVFGAGPGAFTGLRIACGVAQGLALARGLPVLGVSCLEAVAHASGATHAVVCLDARMGEVYHAAYERRPAQAWRQVIAPNLCRPQDVPMPPPARWVGCGSGFEAHGAELVDRHGERLVAVKPDLVPAARAMLELALPRLAAGEGVDAAAALPTYLRDRVALTVVERGAPQ